MNTIQKIYHSQFGTVCEELKAHKYISGLDYIALRRYEDQIPYSICLAYRFVIAPVVALIRLFPATLPLVNRIARAVWIDRAVRLGRNLK